MPDITDLSEKAFKALQFEADLRKYCLEMAIYNLGSDERNSIQIAAMLENYILNGKTHTTS